MKSLGFVFIVVYTLKSKKVAKSGLCKILSFGVPTAVIVFLYWGASEVQAILVGISGVNELAAWVMINNFYV